MHITWNEHFSPNMAEIDGRLSDFRLAVDEHFVHPADHDRDVLRWLRLMHHGSNPAVLTGEGDHALVHDDTAAAMVRLDLVGERLLNGWASTRWTWTEPQRITAKMAQRTFGLLVNPHPNVPVAYEALPLLVVHRAATLAKDFVAHEAIEDVLRDELGVAVHYDADEVG